MPESPPEPSMSHAEALVRLYQELLQLMRSGDERRAGSYRQAIADLIDPPRTDPTGPNSIVGGEPSYADTRHHGPAPRRPVTAAELARVYAELAAWSHENGDREQAGGFEIALAEIGDPDTFRPEWMPGLLRRATTTLAPGWVRPQPPDSVRAVGRMFADSPGSEGAAAGDGPEASAEADQPEPVTRRPGPEPGSGRGRQ